MCKILLALLSLLACSVHASVVSAPTVQTTLVTASPNATCPSRTVNYITHGLPQQCLTSSWRSTSTSLAVKAPDETTLGDDTLPTYASDSTSGSADRIENSIETPQGTLGTPSATSIDAFTSTTTSSAPLSSTTPASASVESDETSPLEDEKFMSFEEWKKQNLQKVGQSEHVGRDAQVERTVQRKRPSNIPTALDSLGDDSEIELDFSGFIPDGPDLQALDQQISSNQQDVDMIDSQTVASPTPGHRSKDAGTTCKERYNYASFDCAANVRKWNPEATTPLTVLGENKDSYMLNVCSIDNKFLIIELCNDISIDTVVLANFEFFSSTFRTFRVSVSDKYPVKVDKWKTLGTFEARNTREVQPFLVENPVIWARYLRIEFLTHYGSEYYCPVSLVRVHGKTMMEEYKHDMESLQDEEEDTVDRTEAVGAAGETLASEAVADVVRDERERIAQEASQESATDILAVSATEEDSEPLIKSENLDPATYTALGTSVNNLDEAAAATGTSPLTRIELTHMVAEDTCPTSSSSSARAVISSEASSRSPSAASPGTKMDARQSEHGYVTAANSTSENLHSTPPPVASSLKAQRTNDAPRISSNVTSSERQKASPTATQNQAAIPTMQESFFKSVQKRLQMLEANSSLSLQYIEDQSRALRDAFNRVEQKQLAKTTTFLDYLNTTVLSELRDFRQQYDQLWQSTVIELEIQRERYQQETVAINARLGVLADELILQKRVSILQMILILVCLGLVMFSRGNLHQYLEMPVVQRVLSRSPSSRWLNVASGETPTQSPPPTRDGSILKRNGMLKEHHRMQSEDSIDESLSPQEIYSPPTPVSVEDASEVEATRAVSTSEDPQFDPSSIERPSTSPPMLPGSATPSTPEPNDMAGHDTIDSRLLDLSLKKTSEVPRVVVEEATPPMRHLTWDLPPNS